MPLNFGSISNPSGRINVSCAHLKWKDFINRNCCLRAFLWIKPNSRVFSNIRCETNHWKNQSCSQVLCIKIDHVLKVFKLNLIAATQLLGPQTWLQRIIPTTPLNLYNSAKSTMMRVKRKQSICHFPLVSTKKNWQL